MRTAVAIVCRTISPPARAALWLLAAALTLTATPATAQDAQAPKPLPSSAEQPVAGGEEVITVTSRKIEENLQDVPIAVTAITGEALEESAAADISELQTQVPNLTIFQGRNQSTTLTTFVRGIGQADPLWGVDPGVGLYFDDVYIARPQGALLDVYDVGRIEVLRGPQGTLYGKNTIGGAIKYVSRPISDELGGVVSLSGGDYSTFDVRAGVSGALIPGKLLGKIAIASMKRDGYGTNRFTGRDVSDRDTLAGRLAFDWLASDAVKVQFSYDMTRDDAEPKGYQRLAANPFCGLFGVTCPPFADRWDTESGLAPINGTDSEGGSLVVSWSIDDRWSFKSITAYRESDSENNIDFDTTPARIADVTATYYDEQLSEELQFIYTGEKLTGVFGVYYFDGEAGGLVKNVFFEGTCAVCLATTDGKTLTDSIALFGDGSWVLSPSLSLNFGLRATREKKNGIAFNAFYTNDSFATVSAVTADYDKTTTFNSIAPKLGIDYRFDDDVMGYVSYSRGFKSGGYNVRAQATVFPESAEPFDDEVLDMVEVGVKSVLAEGSLVLNSALFYGAYKDVQVSTFSSYDSNGDGLDDAFFGNFLNGGDATLKGVELEFNWTSPTVDWLGFSGFASYLDASPDDFLDANRNGIVDTQLITNAPEWTAGLRANFDFPAWGGLITASAGAAYRGDSVLTNEGEFSNRPLPPLTQDAFWLYDAWISWLSPDSKWRIGINGKNLSDEEYLTNGYNIASIGVKTGSYGNPRSVVGTIEYRF